MKFGNKFACIVDKCHPDHIQKENFKNFDICFGKLRPQDEKTTEKWDDPLPLHPHSCSLRHFQTTKIYETFRGGSPSQNHGCKPKKNNQKSIHKGPGAVAFILAFLPFLRPRGRK